MELRAVSQCNYGTSRTCLLEFVLLVTSISDGNDVAYDNEIFVMFSYTTITIRRIVNVFG
jgi:hypothetical protein